VIPYEWVDRRGQAVLEGWALEKRQMRQLRMLLLRIEGTDYEVANGSLIFKKRGAEGLYYIKVNGNEALRPRCCLGPELDREELRRAALEASPEKKSILTFLERVTKKDGVEDPPMKSSKYRERAALIEEDRQNRKAVKMHHQGGPT
jgi:hypothetical protein